MQTSYGKLQKFLGEQLKKQISFLRFKLFLFLLL